jgi:hypothetical protein
MASDELIRMADRCGAVRRSIGRVLMSPDGSSERVAAEERFHEELRLLLRQVREQECALLLEAAGELAR